jgi:hypothetical protein
VRNEAKGSALVAAPVLGERGVGEVDQVDVAVDDDALAPRFERDHGAPRGPRRIRCDSVDVEDLDPELLDPLALELRRLLRPPADQRHLLGREEGSLRPRLDQLSPRAVDAQHVGEPHPVESALVD